MKRTILGAVLAALALNVAPAAAASFFKGKTLTYIVATKPGGGYDAYGRLVAKYLGKHLPVDKVIVRNIPGAGHIIGANHINAAKPDGLTIGTFNTGLIYAQILQRKGAKFDLRKMSWIGKAASDSRTVVVSEKSGFKSFAEFAAASKPAKMAVSGIGSAAYNDMRLIVEALSLNVKLVPGFAGNEGEMSMLRGEVAGTIGSRSSMQPFVDNNNGRFILEIGGVARPGVPQARSLVKDAKGKSIVALIESQSTLGRLTAGPPGIPADRLAELRGAYAKALSDPGLLAEARKMKRPIDAAGGAEVAKMVDGALNQSPETVALIASIMNLKALTVTVKSSLLKVSKKGKSIVFMSGKKKIKSKVSGSRTKITIGGKKGTRKALKAGMTCTIEFKPGGKNEPKTLDCGA